MASANDPPSEVYPLAPLAAVAIEVHYKPLLDALDRFSAFQREHDEEYPHVVLPDDLGDVTLRRRRVATLVHESGDRAVAIGRDLVAVVTYDYENGFPGFSSWALPVLRKALDAIQPTRLERLRYVYENEIRAPDGSDLDLRSMFRIELPRDPNAEGTVHHLHLSWTQPWPTGKVHVRLDSCASSMEKGMIDLTITSDCSWPTEETDIGNHVREAHRIARLTFEALITDAYRERLRKTRST